MIFISVFPSQSSAQVPVCAETEALFPAMLYSRIKSKNSCRNRSFSIFTIFLFCGVDGIACDADDRLSVNLESRRSVKFDSYVVSRNNLCHLRMLNMLTLED